jgi:hypothetical protein
VVYPSKLTEAEKVGRLGRFQSKKKKEVANANDDLKEDSDDEN